MYNALIFYLNNKENLAYLTGGIVKRNKKKKVILVKIEINL